MPFRPAPTASRADEIRAALKAAGIPARVARQPYAYRVVSDQADAVLPVLLSLGLAGPAGGEPVRNGLFTFFAYEAAQ